MDAQVTLKLAPQEFDQVRAALRAAQSLESHASSTGMSALTGNELSPSEQRSARQRVTEYHDLLERLS